jgi:protein phosphatase
MIRAPHTDLVVGYQTHPGETGKNNEDRWAIAAYEGAPGEKGGALLAVVADGIGGHSSGEVASQLAADTTIKIFDQAASRAYPDLFTRAFANTAQAIARHIAAHPETEKMGTTCAAAVIADRRLYTATIGDSRIYLIRDGAIKQVSVDHTWVQEAVEHGILTREEARRHPNRHVVRRYLGGPDSIPDFRLQLHESESEADSIRNQGLPLKPGDVVLLSSDGLTDIVEDDEILAAFQEHKRVQAAAEALTLLARQRGGPDNITLIAIQIPGKHKTVPPRRGERRLGWGPALAGLLGGIGLTALAAAAIIGGYFFFTQPTATPTPSAITSQPTLTRPPDPPTTRPPTTQAATLVKDTPTPFPPTATNTPQPTIDRTQFPDTPTVESETPTPTATLSPDIGTPSTETPIPAGTTGP